MAPVALQRYLSFARHVMPYATVSAVLPVLSLLFMSMFDFDANLHVIATTT